MDLFLNPNLQQEIMESILGRDHPPAKFRENHPLFKSFSVQIIFVLFCCPVDNPTKNQQSDTAKET